MNIQNLGFSKTGDTCEYMKARISKKRHAFALLKASVAYNFPIIENKAEDLLFKCQVSIVIRMRDMASNSKVNKQDPSVY